MAKYAKETRRINVKFIDTDTEELIFEIKNRNWQDVGQIFADGIVSSLMTNDFKGKVFPKNVMVIAVGEYFLQKEIK